MDFALQQTDEIGRTQPAVNLGAFLPGIFLVPLPLSISVSLQVSQMSLFLSEVPAEAMVILEVVAGFKYCSTCAGKQPCDSY